MTTRTAFTPIAWMLAFGLVLGLPPARGLDGQEKPGKDEKPAKEKKSVKKDEAKKDAASDPVMEAWKKAGTPGKQHELLKKMEGQWAAASTFWMAPGAEPIQEKGRMTCRVILGGRFLSQDYRGSFMGEEFHGMGTFGYDNLKKKYVATWMDTMMTGVMLSEGSLDDAGKVLTLHSTFIDPLTNAPKTMRMVTTFIDDDHHKDEGFETGPDGKEFKSMEISYTRRRVAEEEKGKAKARAKDIEEKKRDRKE
jgi:hypothetical protein